METIRIFLKSGAVVEATLEDFSVAVNPQSGKIVKLGFKQPHEYTDTPWLAFVDISDISAITYVHPAEGHADEEFYSGV